MISVVIASKNRRDLARRVVAAVKVSLSGIAEDSEIVLVDDGSSPPYREDDFPEVRLLRGAGVSVRMVTGDNCGGA